MKTCSRDGCERIVDCHGLCKTHYEMARLDGSIPTGRTCEMDGCTLPHKARGMCKPHYEQARNAGIFPSFRHRPCSVEGCDATTKTRGLCNTHYEQLRRAGALDTRPRRGSRCLVASCDGKPVGLGLCQRHYNIRATDGKPFVPSVRTPCAGKFSTWVPADDPGPVAAWELCKHCPCIGECAEWAAIHAPSAGVWAGVWRGPA